MTKTEQLACHECDLLVALPELSEGQKAVCPRCGYLLTRRVKNAQSRLAALSSGALLFLGLSVFFPFLSFTVQGNEREVTLLQSIYSIGDEIFLSVAIFLFLTTILIPAVFLTGMLYVLLSVKNKQLFPYTSKVLYGLFMLLPWDMSEIFLVGILVSFVKIATLADISFGLSFISYTLFILCLAATLMTLDKFQIWQWVKYRDERNGNIL